VATRFGDASGGAIGALVGLAKVFAISPQKGAETMVWLASSPDVEGVSGKYFYKKRPWASSAEARDREAAERLWTASEAIAGM
jgi:hypothetical protein